MKKLIIMFVLALSVSSPVLSASTGSSNSENTRMRHTTYQQCPSSNRTCGRWYYGDNFGSNVSDFMANYNWPSNHGSQASMKLSNGEIYRDTDTSTGEKSEAYVQTNANVSNFYYDYI